MIDPQTAPENVQEVIRRHLAGGHQLTNEKRTLLHNVNAFLAIEEASYTLDRDLQERIGKLDADLFEYAISVSNECLVCTTYFSRLLREEHHLDPSDFKLTRRQELLMNYARKLGSDPKSITDEEFTELKEDFLRHGDKRRSTGFRREGRGNYGDFNSYGSDDGREQLCERRAARRRVNGSTG